MNDLKDIIDEENRCKFFKLCDEPLLQSCLTPSHYLCNMYVYYLRLEDEEKFIGGKDGYNQ